MSNQHDVTRPESVHEPESSDAKEVYAFYGLAAYYAAVLERVLISFVVIAHRAKNLAMTPQEIDALFTKTEFQTLGNVLRLARTVGPVPDNLEADLRDAVALRNSLIHSWFWDHAEDFMSASGRSLMIDDLRHRANRFMALARQLEQIAIPMMKRWGVTREWVETEFERLHSLAIGRDTAKDPD